MSEPHGFQGHGHQPQLAFLVDSMDDVLCHHRCRDDLWNLVELCSGMGIGTMGFGQAGMKTVVAADWCRPFPEAFKEIRGNIPIVTGYIGDEQVLKQLFREHLHPTTLMCGFSCQLVALSVVQMMTVP